MKRIIVAVLLLAVMAIILASCGVTVTTGASENPPKEVSPFDSLSCQRIIDCVYDKCGEIDFVKSLSESGNRLVTKTLTSQIGKDYFGTEIAFTSAAASEPDIQPPAFSFCVAVMPDGTNMESTVDAIKNNADPQKWVCTGVSTVYVESAGNVVALIMADKDTADALKAAFIELSNVKDSADITMKKGTMLTLIDNIYSGATDGCQRAQSYFGEYRSESFRESELKSGTERYFGTAIEFDMAIYTGSTMMPDPFMMCLIKPNSESDIGNIITAIKDNADLSWQICVSADSLEVVQNGGYVLMIMGTEEETQTLSASFLALDLK